MKKKYEIKNNRPELTKAEVEQGMDFNKIAQAVPQARVFSLGKILVTGLAAAAVIAAVVFWPRLTGSDDRKKNGIVQLPTKSNPDTFVVSCNTDTTLIYNSGTTIRIPAHVFVDEHGAPVKGNVKINYREFHSVGDILLSAIPMRYDSAGKEMYFESAGMFDISAEQNNKMVYIQKDKSLEVSMATLDRTEKKFNQYLLDEKTGNWSFVKKDEVSTLSKPNTVHVAAVDSVQSTRPVKPLGERMFTIDVTGRPELEGYRGVVFEVTKDCKNFDQQEAKIDWGMVDIEKTDKDLYKVTFSYPFSGPDRKYEVTARPLKDGNMENAVKKFDELYADYKNKLAAAQRADHDAEETLKREQQTYETVYSNYVALQAKNEAIAIENAVKTAQVTQVVYRTFQVKQFGIWNSDCPASMPQGVEVFAKFETVTGEKVNIASVYLVEKGRNALFNLYVPQKFSFNPDAENILIVITNDHKVGWVKNNAFESIGKDTKNYTFKLNMLDKENYTPADIDGIVI